MTHCDSASRPSAIIVGRYRLIWRPGPSPALTLELHCHAIHTVCSRNVEGIRAGPGGPASERSSVECGYAGLEQSTVDAGGAPAASATWSSARAAVLRHTTTQ